MCGIAGFTWKDESLIGRMTALLRHRGPDQDGVYCDGSVSLGHRRLSIIDLSERGRQPMPNEDGSVRVIHNGEIYNFPELREDLQRRGHVFRSRTDTEVLVHGYEEYGVDLVERLNGMFAFAVWDGRNRQLLLARDRMGIKPLYYATVRREGQEHLVFASDLKSVVACPDVDRALDLQALYQFMGYEYTPAPRTIFENIRKLPPGHRLVWKAGQPPRVERYWQLRLDTVKRSRAEHEEAIREQLQESVRKRLVSDVPLGVFLSGGLDSTALVAMMSRCGVDPIRTFSLHYSDPTFSEIEYARVVAKEFGTEHHEILIDPLSPDIIDEMVWYMDEPMAELSAFPFYMLSKMAREHVTVCLSGEGSDEALVGYDRFKASKAHQALAMLPAWFRRGVIGPLVGRLPDQQQKKGAVNLLKRFIEGGLLPEDGEHMRWQYFTTPHMEATLFSPEARRHIAFDPFAPIRALLAETDITKRLDREIYVDLFFMMPDAVCSKVDKMSMAHALEVRVPFLDHEFVELCGSIPGPMKLDGFTTKAIFRSAMRGILPDVIRQRGKQGFSLPIKNWLRNELREYMIDALEASPVIRDVFDMDEVRRLIREHMEYRANHNHVLWSLTNLAVWHRLILETPLGTDRPLHDHPHFDGEARRTTQQSTTLRTQ